MIGLGTKIALGVAAAGTAAAMVAGASFALFSASASSTANTFAAGTVTIDAPTTLTCSLTNEAGKAPTNARTDLAPGDNYTCNFDVTYTGSLGAYLGFEATATSTAATSATPSDSTVGSASLFSSVTGDPNPATLVLTLGSQKATGADTTTTPGSTSAPDASQSTTGTVVYGGSTPTVVTDTQTVDASAEVSLPPAMGNAYQGASGSIQLKVEAIQAANNSGVTASSFNF